MGMGAVNENFEGCVTILLALPWVIANTTNIELYRHILQTHEYFIVRQE